MLRLGPVRKGGCDNPQRSCATKRVAEVSQQSRHQMTLRISGKSISIGEALRARVSERTDEVLRKYFDGNYSGHITLSKDGFGFRTDCSLDLDSGMTLEADSNATRSEE